MSTPSSEPFNDIKFFEYLGRMLVKSKLAAKNFGYSNIPQEEIPNV